MKKESSRMTESGQEAAMGSYRLWPELFKKQGVKCSVLRCLLQCKFLFLFSLPLLVPKLLLKAQEVPCVHVFWKKKRGKKLHSAMGMRWDGEKEKPKEAILEGNEEFSRSNK